MSVVFALTLAVGLRATPAHGAPLPREFENNGELLLENIPHELRSSSSVFRSRCAQCHSLNRPLEALATGLGPVSGRPFEAEDIKQYVVRMMRKRGSSIRRAEAMALVRFLVFVREVGREAQSRERQDSGSNEELTAD
ncbi:MAG: hypothetical protein HY791_07580 [Deltaproteobacteria bacterium]|nr:hypothetical protein [Deltaproteobacteria bacterium]